MLITVKNHTVLPLVSLMREVLFWIYEPQTFSSERETMMMQSFIQWSKKVDLMAHEKHVLKRMATLLEQNDKGGFERRKELFKEHGIDWRKFHNLPEVQPSKKEFINQFIKNTSNDQRIVQEAQ